MTSSGLVRPCQARSGSFDTRGSLPKPYLDALARLQDKVQPFPFEDVQRTIEEELNVRLSKAFSISTRLR